MNETIAFLSRIYGGFDRHDGIFTMLNLWKHDKGKPIPRAFTYHVSEIPNIDWGEHLEMNAEGWDIYFGLALRHPDFLRTASPGSRGVVEDCILSTALAIDIDYWNPKAHKADKLPADINDAALIIDKGAKDPSIWVHSGWGGHPYWIYNEDVLLDSKSGRVAYGKQRKAAHEPFKQGHKEHGWTYDKTWNIDRIWRLPGFKNWKIRSNPQDVRVLYGLDGDLPKYDLEELIPEKARVSSSAESASVASVLQNREIQKAFQVGDLRQALEGYKDRARDEALEFAASADEELQGRAEDSARRSVYIERLLAGESIEEKGGRDEALTTVCGIISYLTAGIKEYSEADLQFIVDGLMRASLEQWCEDSEDTDLAREMSKTIDKLNRIKAKDAENVIAGLAGLQKALAARKADPLVGDSDDNDEEALIKMGMLVNGRFTYVWDWKNSKYYSRPAIGDKDLRSIIRACWPEHDGECVFKHSFVNEENKAIELPLDSLQRNYGSSIEKSHFSFLAEQSTFDPEKRLFVINPAPWRFTEPLFDQSIDDWIRLLGGGGDYDAICDWLAGVTQLDKPCAALYFNGPPGCGKSLFAHGAAQLWAESAPLYEGVAGQFNESLMVSPVILIDEGFIENGDIKSPTKMMRRLIAQGSHTVNLKHGPKLPLLNHLRFIVAANNEEVFITGKEERLSENDSRAMAERIYYIKVPDTASRFFYKHNRGNKLTKRWLGPSGDFAKHVLWLRDHRDLSNRGRFLVEGKQTELTDQMLFQGNERNLVWEWIVRFCEAPMILNSKIPKGIYPAEIGDGIVAINTKLLKENWPVYTGGRDPIIDHSHLLRHLKALSYRDTTIKMRLAGSQIRYWVISIDLVLSYAEKFDIGDIERIKKFAERSTPITQKIINSIQYDNNIPDD